MPTLWSLEVNKINQQVKVIMIIFNYKCFNFLTKKTMYRKLVSETLHQKRQKFYIKIYLESFVSIYHLHHLFEIIYKSIFYNLNIT